MTGPSRGTGLQCLVDQLVELGIDLEWTSLRLVDGEDRYAVTDRIAQRATGAVESLVVGR